MIDCGPRLGKLSLHQFSRATCKHGLGTCLSATPIQAGLFKQNVLLETQHGEWIFRGCSHYSWQFPKERFFANFIAEQTNLPTPRPYLIDTSLEHFHYDFALMPKMPGIQLSDQSLLESLSDDDFKKIAYELGQTLRKLQTFQAPFYGEYDEFTNTVVPYKESYDQQLLQKVRALIEASNVTHQTISNDEERKLMTIFQAHLKHVTSSFPVITLQDYKADNTCVMKVNSDWQVTGIFDLMEARFGHHLEDLPRQHATYIDAQQLDLADEFLLVYDLAESDLPLLNCFIIIDRLIVWEYMCRNIDAWKEKPFSKWVQKYCLTNLSLFK
ncbi:MAG: aminoglycoside phosphotransferase family protein [Deinococcota bacterium]